jgi:outer membrane protein assembly factor BamB
MAARLRSIVTAGFLVFTVVSPAFAEDWPHFRGEGFDSVVKDASFKKDWDKPLPLVWEREIGSAFSSFALVDGALYTCGAKGGKQVLYALKADSGEVIWENAFEDEFRNEFGDGTRATPTVSDGRVYILGANGRLLCADAKTGAKIWDKTFSHKPTWAYSGSVLVEGDLAIASGGKDDGALVAFDRKTGAEKWKTGNDPVGYATPYPFTFGGKRYVAGFLGNSAIVVDAATGREAWRTPWKTDWDVNAATPIFHDGHLFLTSGYKTGCGLFKLTASGDRIEGSEVWKSKVLLDKFQTPVLFEGKLYSSDQRGFRCVDFMTGMEEWEVAKVKDSPLLVADGHILLLTENGKLQIGPAKAAGFEPTTTAEILTGRCWSLPILVDGRLYARNLERVKCFDLRG